MFLKLGGKFGCFTLRAYLHGGGGPQAVEVTCGGSPHLSCKRDQIRMRDYVERRVTPPKRVTSPTWGSPPPSKQTLNSKKDERNIQTFVFKCSGDLFL